uniref:Uncharacterized protein n=1 Tax=Arundo donax TaxID=35708 RepID=A0A0A9HGC0_ARUDO
MKGEKTYSRKNNWICEIRLLTLWLRLCVHPLQNHLSPHSCQQPSNCS